MRTSVRLASLKARVQGDLVISRVVLGIQVSRGDRHRIG